MGVVEEAGFVVLPKRGVVTAVLAQICPKARRCRSCEICKSSSNPGRFSRVPVVRRFKPVNTDAQFLELLSLG